MDGTLLDLHFDTHFWLEHIPKKMAEKHNKSIELCRQEMRKAYAEVEGRIEWYCLDHWAKELDIDIMSAKRDVAHLISLRADTIPFLDALKAAGKKVVLVTNAHPNSLSLKVEKTQLDSHIDELISTHIFGVTKESQLLWEKLQNHLGFDASRCLFVDDSQVILDAAKTFGIAYTLGITNPDSQQPENTIEGHASTNNYHDLLDELIASTNPEPALESRTLRVIVASKNPVKIEAARESIASAIEGLFDKGGSIVADNIDVISVDAPSNVPDQPMTAQETRDGAVNRVRYCQQYASEHKIDADFYIAYEGGVEVLDDIPSTYAVVCVADNKRCQTGRSASLPLPQRIYDELLAGKELGPAMDALFNTVNIKQKGGAIGQLSKGLQSRKSIYVSATQLTLSVFFYPELFS